MPKFSDDSSFISPLDVDKSGRTSTKHHQVGDGRDEDPFGTRTMETPQENQKGAIAWRVVGKREKFYEPISIRQVNIFCHSD